MESVVKKDVVCFSFSSSSSLKIIELSFCLGGEQSVSDGAMGIMNV